MLGGENKMSAFDSFLAEQIGLNEAILIGEIEWELTAEHARQWDGIAWLKDGNFWRCGTLQDLVKNQFRYWKPHDLMSILLSLQARGLVECIWIANTPRARVLAPDSVGIKRDWRDHDFLEVKPEDSNFVFFRPITPEEAL
jgi:hypothetical protein